MILKGNIEDLSYETTHSSGLDLRSAIYTTLQSGDRMLIMTGVYIEDAEENEELQIRSRSGLAYKHGVVVLNGVGTIDADYEGEIGVLLINFGNEPFEIKVGDKIAQAVLMTVNKVANIKIKDVTRGSGGFGSTGVK